MRLESMVIVVLLVALGYFAFHYLSLCYGMNEIIKEIKIIQGDLTQNQMLHLPIPNRHLAKLLSSFNCVLENVQMERQKYDKREKEFRKQIENVSHDLRTPLTVILGYMKLIQKDEIKDKQLLETIDIVQRKSKVMSKLVTQFYDFTRINTGDYKINITNVDISKALRESLLENYQIMERSNLQIQVDIPEHAEWVLGEETALERIFSNLFQNASRYAKTYFRLSMKKVEQTVTILFVNDTQQISPDEIPHLFERFYMQDNARNQGGTGLGLTVAKLLAEEMGATLEAYSFDQESTSSNIGIPQICFELRMKAVSHELF